jgi:hypothetical protein
MGDAKQLVTDLFKSNGIVIPEHRMKLFDRFLQDKQNLATLHQLRKNQEQLMANWKTEDRIAEIVQQPIRIPNATVGKPYAAPFDFEQYGWNDLVAFRIEGLEALGLTYSAENNQLTGIPTHSGDLKFSVHFKVEGQPEEGPFHQKDILLIINPDPKGLWKNLESDRNDPYWKENDVTLFAPIGDRHLLVSSKRGRSHATVGSFREDDFAFRELPNGWNIVVVSDGAGSAKLSRKGFALACAGVVDYFLDAASVERMTEFDNLVQQHASQTGTDTQKDLNRFVYNNLGKAAFQVHKQLESFAKAQEVTLKDLSSTLIFTLFKKYDVGYALLSFGVGDCPIAVLNKDVTEVTLMNWIDVGEFGGGTRFITMPKIFQNEKFATRFGFKLIDDFSYLIMMSDGIYDPKFVVEANLPNIAKWQEFLADLNGQNEDKATVELSTTNPDIEEQLSKWMDFWSTGNHDDRTLAIVF